MRSIIPAILLSISFANCAIAMPSIHSSVVGDKALELVQTRQLTFKTDEAVDIAAVSPNGKYVAYAKQAGDSFNISIISSLGGAAKSLLVGSAITQEPSNKSSRLGRWLRQGPIVWSPDSRLIAVAASYYEEPTDPNDKKRPETHILLVQTDGKLRASYQLKGKVSQEIVTPAHMLFSPDSKRLALSVQAAVSAPLREEQRPVCRVEIVDVASGRTSDLDMSKAVRAPQILSWTEDGSALLCEDAGALVRVALSTGSVETLSEDNPVPGHVYYSCDGKYGLHYTLGKSQSGITVRNEENGKDVQIAKSQQAEFESWFANGDLLLYALPQTVRDDSGKRTRELNSLWLASVACENQAVCVALDADRRSATFSYDYRRMAYLLDGRIYVAELEWRAPTPDEKLDAGCVLTEEEEKRALVEQARQIGTASEQCSMERKTDLPSSLTDLEAYAGPKTFLRPGTNQMIFRFLLDPNPWKIDAEGRRYLPGDTIIGEFDAGYGWKMVVYIGGDSEIVAK